MDFLTILYLFAACFFSVQSGVGSIGINYGLLGDNLTSPTQVVSLLQSRSITKVHIFEPNEAVLRALQGSYIEVIMGINNLDLPQIATNPDMAVNWVDSHVIPFLPSITIRYISAGNEVIPSEFSSYILGALQNLDAALKGRGLNIPVTTTVSSQVLGNSYPPSSGVFADMDTMVPIVQFLQDHRYPLLCTIYPYFAYIGNPVDISLDYALFGASAAPVMDGPNGEFAYLNLFYAMVDATYAALEKAGGPDVEIVVSETGWPSGGGGDNIASVDNARVYMNNLVSHVDSGIGTPRRPGRVLETYIFALFNEDLKPGGTEQHFGMYYPDMTEVYHVNL